MQINDLELPHAFVGDVQAGRFRETRGSWELIENRDAHGKPLETEIAYVLEAVAELEKATGELGQNFCCINTDDIDEYDETLGAARGEIPYIWDFSQLICFAKAADDAPFCFDFRENADDPSVIWWADEHWQRVAPNYESFLSLFEWKPIKEN